VGAKQHTATLLPAQNNTRKNTPMYLSCMPGSAFDISFQFTMIENRLLRKVLAFEEK
jgi:hypothetical protein